MNERWVPVRGYEDAFEVSDLGRIKSLPRNNTKGRVLSQYKNKKNGYMYVSLSKDNRAITHRVHKLVYYSFNDVDPPNRYDKLRTIDHINGDKTDNRLSNLEECTQSENQRRAYALGINGKVQRAVIDLTTNHVFESMTDAARSVGGRKAASITRVCKGERSQYRNHRFAYLDDYERGMVPTFAGIRPRRSSEGLWR